LQVVRETLEGHLAAGVDIVPCVGQARAQRQWSPGFAVVDSALEPRA
jgi:hypothetical protein